MEVYAELDREQAIDDPRKHLVRYFGFYSNKSRGRRAKAKGDPPPGLSYHVSYRMQGARAI